jgi:beta-lactamase class D
MRTTNKIVIATLETHILDNFAPENYDSESNSDTLTNLREQIDSMRYDNQTIYQTALNYVEGGSLLISYTDQRKFLDNLDINPTRKQYSDDRVFKLYCHLCARTMANLYTRGIK